ncbi:hypothetical protein HZH68_005812 [Vespula germanica]|uniref:Uncharacterized protein n=1 Tax=Vespula germanica TaxID=30212 RepID=A0A834NGD0_VESGE|nr:hypothetical protein HZH68_005812 [Vespula germanica]
MCAAAVTATCCLRTALVERFTNYFVGEKTAVIGVTVAIAVAATARDEDNDERNGVFDRSIFRLLDIKDFFNNDDDHDDDDVDADDDNNENEVNLNVDDVLVDPNSSDKRKLDNNDVQDVEILREVTRVAGSRRDRHIARPVNRCAASRELSFRLPKLRCRA